MARGVTWAGAVLVVPLCVAMAACDWPWRHDMADEPSRPASAGARPPADAVAATTATPTADPDVAEQQLHNPIAADSPTDRGQRLYLTYCQPCHGASGKGDGPIARYFRPPMGDLTSAAVQGRADGWMYAVITRGTEHMPRSAYELTPIERWEIVHFVRTFGGRRP